MEPRLKTKLWIQAQLRRCDQEFIPFMVLKKGDSDAGAILLKISDREGNSKVYTQTRTLTGDPAWRLGTGPSPVNEETAQAYISRQQKYDSDLWVIEIEDAEGRYEFDRDIVL
ncbi:MAG: DUF1491 family protein [Rhodospirillales bacterium]|nr:DUF1491 family protein [Rhodospirillales bacterium]